SIATIEEITLGLLNKLVKMKEYSLYVNIIIGHILYRKGEYRYRYGKLLGENNYTEYLRIRNAYRNAIEISSTEVAIIGNDIDLQFYYQVLIGKLHFWLAQSAVFHYQERGFYDYLYLSSIENYNRALKSLSTSKGLSPFSSYASLAKETYFLLSQNQYFKLIELYLKTLEEIMDSSLFPEVIFFELLKEVITKFSQEEPNTLVVDILETCNYLIGMFSMDNSLEKDYIYSLMNNVPPLIDMLKRLVIQEENANSSNDLKFKKNILLMAGYLLKAESKFHEVKAEVIRNPHASFLNEYSVIIDLFMQAIEEALKTDDPYNNFFALNEFNIFIETIGEFEDEDSSLYKKDVLIGYNSLKDSCKKLTQDNNSGQDIWIEVRAEFQKFKMVVSKFTKISKNHSLINNTHHLNNDLHSSSRHLRFMYAKKAYLGSFSELEQGSFSELEHGVRKVSFFHKIVEGRDPMDKIAEVRRHPFYGYSDSPDESWNQYGRTSLYYNYIVASQTLGDSNNPNNQYLNMVPKDIVLKMQMLPPQHAANMLKNLFTFKRDKLSDVISMLLSLGSEGFISETLEYFMVDFLEFESHYVIDMINDLMKESNGKKILRKILENLNITRIKSFLKNISFGYSHSIPENIQRVLEEVIINLKVEQVSKILDLLPSDLVHEIFNKYPETMIFADKIEPEILVDFCRISSNKKLAVELLSSLGMRKIKLIIHRIPRDILLEAFKKMSSDKLARITTCYSYTLLGWLFFNLPIDRLRDLYKEFIWQNNEKMIMATFTPQAYLVENSSDEKKDDFSYLGVNSALSQNVKMSSFPVEELLPKTDLQSTKKDLINRLEELIAHPAMSIGLLARILQMFPVNKQEEGKLQSLGFIFPTLQEIFISSNGPNMGKKIMIMNELYEYYEGYKLKELIESVDHNDRVNILLKLNSNIFVEVMEIFVGQRKLYNIDKVDINRLIIAMYFVDKTKVVDMLARISSYLAAHILEGLDNALQLDIFMYWIPSVAVGMSSLLGKNNFDLDKGGTKDLYNVGTKDLYNIGTEFDFLHQYKGGKVFQILNLLYQNNGVFVEIKKTLPLKIAKEVIEHNIQKIASLFRYSNNLRNSIYSLHDKNAELAILLLIHMEVDILKGIMINFPQESLKNEASKEVVLKTDKNDLATILQSDFSWDYIEHQLKKVYIDVAKEQIIKDYMEIDFKREFRLKLKIMWKDQFKKYTNIENYAWFSYEQFLELKQSLKDMEEKEFELYFEKEWQDFKEYYQLNGGIEIDHLLNHYFFLNHQDVSIEVLSAEHIFNKYLGCSTSLLMIEDLLEQFTKGFDRWIRTTLMEKISRGLSREELMHKFLRGAYEQKIDSLFNRVNLDNLPNDESNQESQLEILLEDAIKKKEILPISKVHEFLMSFPGEILDPILKQNIPLINNIIRVLYQSNEKQRIVKTFKRMDKLGDYHNVLYENIIIDMFVNSKNQAQDIKMMVEILPMMPKELIQTFFISLLETSFFSMTHDEITKMKIFEVVARIMIELFRNSYLSENIEIFAKIFSYSIVNVGVEVLKVMALMLSTKEIVELLSLVNFFVTKNVLIRLSVFYQKRAVEIFQDLNLSYRVKFFDNIRNENDFIIALLAGMTREDIIDALHQITSEKKVLEILINLCHLNLETGIAVLPLLKVQLLIKILKISDKNQELINIIGENYSADKIIALLGRLYNIDVIMEVIAGLSLNYPYKAKAVIDFFWHDKILMSRIYHSKKSGEVLSFLLNMRYDAQGVIDLIRVAKILGIVENFNNRLALLLNIYQVEKGRTGFLLGQLFKFLDIKFILWIFTMKISEDQLKNILKHVSMGFIMKIMQGVHLDTVPPDAKQKVSYLDMLLLKRVDTFITVLSQLVKDFNQGSELEPQLSSLVAYPISNTREIELLEGIFESLLDFGKIDSMFQVESMSQDESESKKNKHSVLLYQNIHTRKIIDILFLFEPKSDFVKIQNRWNLYASSLLNKAKGNGEYDMFIHQIAVFLSHDEYTIPLHFLFFILKKHWNVVGFERDKFLALGKKLII
ncbi:MAG: hypothetical protein GY817_07485, partial [bacterium]|nr:hypothetical protein [bacterium]